MLKSASQRSFTAWQVQHYHISAVSIKVVGKKEKWVFLARCA